MGGCLCRRLGGLLGEGWNLDCISGCVDPPLGLLSAGGYSGDGLARGLIEPRQFSPVQRITRLALVDARRLPQVRPDGDIRHVTAPASPMTTSSGHDGGPTRTPRVSYIHPAHSRRRTRAVASFFFFLFSFLGYPDTRVGPAFHLWYGQDWQRVALYDSAV